MEESLASAGRLRLRVVLAWALVAAVGLGSILGAGLIDVRQRGADRRERALRADAAMGRVERQLARAATGIRTVSAVFASRPRVSGREFSVIARSVIGWGTIDAVSWHPDVPRALRRAYEREFGAIRGAPGIVSGDADHLFPAAYREPAGRRIVRGTDLASLPGGLAALAAARDLGTPQFLPQGGEAGGAAVIAPLYRVGASTRTRADRRGAFTGVILGLLSGGALAEAALDRLPAGSGVQISLAGASVADAGVLHGPIGRSGGGSSGRRVTLALTVPGGPGIPWPWMALALGLGLTVAAGIMVAQSQGFERRANRLIARRMAERDRAEVALRNSEAENRTLAAVATAVANELATEEILAVAAREAAHLVEAPRAWVVRDGGRREVVASWPSDATEPPPDDALRAPVRVAGAAWGELCASDAAGYDVERQLARVAELVALGIANAEARRTLRAQATTDALTGLANRRLFEARLRGEVERAHRHGRALSLAILDVDHFKRVNDVHGHPAGDRVLVEVAERLLGEARTGDLVARLGGEEFAWILVEADGPAARAAAERARTALAARPIAPAGDVRASLGVATLAAGDDPDALLSEADAALYRAKRAGRDRVCGPETDAITETQAV